MIYKRIIKPILFLWPPERAHQLTTQWFGWLCKLPGLGALFTSYYKVNHPKLVKECFGLTFPNPVGLAAGFDKDGLYFRDMAKLGFGFVELGTVTPRPQVGNPQPRLFRLPKDNALINRMGFNNRGVDHLVEALKKKRPPHLIIGGNIGKNKDTPNDKAIEDYEYGFVKLFPYVDYFVVNVSSPNTPNLRALQDKEPLTALLSHLQALNQKKESPKPILLKIAPDLTQTQLDDVVEIVQQTHIAGIVATNTTIDRSKLSYAADYIQNIGAGGLSGRPVKERSNEVIRYIHQKSGGAIPIIGVGGIQSGADVHAKLEAGASLVQVYSGLVYEGPAMIKRINQYLLKQ